MKPFGLAVVVLSLAACDDGPPARYPEAEYSAQATVETTTPREDVGASGEAQGYDDTDPSALTDFHEALDGRGSWVDDRTYGTVWVPSQSAVGPDFTPYLSNGRWAYDDDYVWVSDYDWGWAPFHYGRWVYLSGPGWVWIPGRRYAGAWVTWRTGDPGYGYVGWAPAPPVYVWQGRVAVGISAPPVASYTFVRTNEVFAPAVSNRVIAGPQVATIASQTHVYAPVAPATRGVAAASATLRPIGPPPAQLGINPTTIARPAPNEPSLVRAAQVARPPIGQSPAVHAPGQFAAPTRPSNNTPLPPRQAPPEMARPSAPLPPPSAAAPQSLQRPQQFGPAQPRVIPTPPRSVAPARPRSR